MNDAPVRVSAGWLKLREPADAAARSVDLAQALREWPSGPGPRVVHDLGSGNGSMGRWLAAQLDGAQHWVLHDLDPELLDAAAGSPPVPPTGSPRPTVETRSSDVTRLTPEDLGGASLVTASALLDLLTADELDRLVRSCVAAGCPVLLTMSVTGRVHLDPPDSLDGPLGAAFNRHQRRTTNRGALLGPDAIPLSVSLFTLLGCQVRTRPSPWRLNGRDRSLTTRWLHGWVDAAVERRPELGPAAAAYVERRAAQLAAGELSVTVEHVDLLATPRGAVR